MLLLPVFNAKLNPCPVSPAEFSPHPEGNFCGQCQRVVHDFSHSLNPRADLVAARAAAPDGRVCGTFSREQLAKPPLPTLSRRLRWFVAALVLVVAQGLSAREALAQVQSGGTGGPVPVALPSAIRPITSSPTPDSTAANAAADVVEKIYGVIVEEMPSLHGGSSREIVQYIQQRIVWPRSKGRMIQMQGRVFASFTVGADGRVGNAKIVKHLHPRFDAEVLRVVRLLPQFKPGKQSGQPVEVSFTLPITFKLK